MAKTTAGTILKFDEIHRLSVPYRDYFGAMYITPEQMHSRIELAEAIEDVMLYIFAYWIIAEEAEISIDEMKRDAIDKLTSVIAKNTELDPYLENHIRELVDEVIDVTKKREDEKKQEQLEREQEEADEEDDIEKMLKDEEKQSITSARAKFLSSYFQKTNGDEDLQDYWLSDDRAMLISENEANSIYNYDEYREAKKSGKTKKTWITELDDKVRFTHTMAEGKTVDIDGLFLVGDSLFRFPKDTMYEPSASETVNCRCACKYE